MDRTLGCVGQQSFAAPLILPGGFLPFDSHRDGLVAFFVVGDEPGNGV